MATRSLTLTLYNKLVQNVKNWILRSMDWRWTQKLPWQVKDQVRISNKFTTEMSIVQLQADGDHTIRRSCLCNIMTLLGHMGRCKCWKNNKDKICTYYYPITGGIILGGHSGTVTDLVSHLKSLFCGTMSIETGHLSTSLEREFINRAFIEEKLSEVTTDEKKRLAEVMIKSEVRNVHRSLFCSSPVHTEEEEYSHQPLLTRVARGHVI